MLATNQAGLSNQQILDIASAEMQATLVGEVIAVQEGFLLYSEGLPVAANTERVRIPERAVANTLNHLYWRTNDTNTNALYRYDQADLDYWNTRDAGVPTGFIVESNYIRLLPKPNIAGTLEVSYPFRPNALVEESSARTVVTVDYETKTIELASIPSSWGSPTKFDVINAQSGNEVLYYDLAGAVVGNAIQFDSDISNIKVGDYVCLPKQSPVPMLPEEMHTWVAEYAAYRIVVERGHSEQIKNLQVRMKKLRESMPQLLDSRIKTKPPIIGGKNPFNRYFSFRR